MTPEFEPFQKIARLNREIIITEKIDGTNAQILVADDGLTWWAGSRSKWLEKSADNYGFWNWCAANEASILGLGPGRHYGEWWGSGIQGGYNLPKGEKRFSLFNTSLWNPTNLPPGIGVVPELYRGPFSQAAIDETLARLSVGGSVAAPDFPKPEGIIIFHTASGFLFKVTLEGDGVPKSLNRPQPTNP